MILRSVLKEILEHVFKKRSQNIYNLLSDGQNGIYDPFVGNICQEYFGDVPNFIQIQHRSQVEALKHLEYPIASTLHRPTWNL